MIRLFVGLALPQAIKTGLMGMMAGLDGVKWQREDQLHLTLNFIGEVPEPLLREIDTALASLSFAPFALRLEGLNIFGSRRRPRMLWSGVQQKGGGQLLHLHAKIDRLLQGCGLAPEKRKYTPHVTLARFKSKSKQLGPYLVHHSGYRSPSFPNSEITLFRSHLGQKGADYAVVSQYPGHSDPVPA